MYAWTRQAQTMSRKANGWQACCCFRTKHVNQGYGLQFAVIMRMTAHTVLGEPLYPFAPATLCMHLQRKKPQPGKPSRMTSRKGIHHPVSKPESKEQRSRAAILLTSRLIALHPDISAVYHAHEQIAHGLGAMQCWRRPTSTAGNQRGLRKTDTMRI